MDERAKELRRQYAREYREKNRDKVNEQKRAWNAANKDKNREYRQRYWQRKAAESGTACLQCGEPFEAKRSDAKFCGASCRVKYNRNK